jgi:hypothetical protein
MLVRNDLSGLVPTEAENSVESWNAQEWDLR